MEGNNFTVLNKLLNDSTKSYIDKVEGLLLGWKNVYSILFKKPTQPYNDAMNYMHKSTLQYLLHGDWTQLEASLRAKFTVILHKVLMAISKTDQEALRRCKLLIKLVHEPWKNSTLHKILHSLSPTDNEVREYISTEGSELLLMRLEVLCEGKCEDLALKLAATLLKHLRQLNGFQKTDIDYISDIVLILLFRFKRNQEIIEKLKNLDLMEGLDLVKRFARKRTSASGLWRYCDKVTEIAAHTVLASGMVQNVESKERQTMLYELINEWALIHIPKLNKCVSTLCNMVRKIVQKAESPIHVYIFAQVLHKQLGDQVKPLCIELYIRGFTSNINLIERYKSSNDYEKTSKAEILLSNSFLELSELLQDNIIIHRECILTAFSLHPTEECFKRLENAALLSCNNCKNGEKYTKTDDTFNEMWNNCDNISCVHAREKTEGQFIEAVNSLNILNSDLLGLAPHLCDDLSTVLCSPRCQTLSWSLGWLHLKNQCEKYLADHSEHKPRCTELKYLNIDYSQFVKQSSNKCNQNLRKFRKKKLNKVFNSNCNLNAGKNISFTNLSNSQKRVIDKNILNYSMLKINDMLFDNYKVYNSLSDDSNDSNIGICQKMYSVNTDDAISYLTSYPPKSKTKNDSRIKDISYYQSNEGSVFSCSNNNPYGEASVHSPKPAEVPPVSFSDAYREKLVPLVKSTAGNSRILLTDVLSKNERLNGDFSLKTESVADKDKCSILSRSSFQSDKLLHKYIPGMNSLDLIVPLRPEPTVQVVQIPSPNTILHPVSSNSSSAIQTNSTSISVAKPLTEPISTQSTEIVATHTQTTHTQVPDSNRDTVNNSNLLLTTVNQGSLPRIHTTDQRHSTLISSNLTSRTQNKSTELSSTSDTISIPSESVNSLVNTTTHEGSTQVTAHIQRVGQPHKQKLLFDEYNLKSTSTQNSNVRIPGSIQVYEEPSKLSQAGSVSGSVYRFILKDGKILEQYCHSNQSSTFPLPDALNDSNLQGTTQQDHVIKLYKKKKDAKKDDHGNIENVQIPSLPQFHQAFRRQVYQGGSIIEGSSISTSPRQFSEDTLENSKQESASSPLSKAVQTVLKDAETSTKCPEKLSEESVSCGSTPSGSESKEDVNDLQSSSGVIFTCKVPIPLAGPVLQAKPVTILKAAHDNLMRNSQKSDNDTKNKDSVIRSSMNALLAAALQNSPVKSNSSDSSSSVHSMKQVKISSQEIKTENCSVGTSKHRMPSPTQKSIRRPSSVQSSTVSPRFSRPPIHSSVNTVNQNAPPVVTIPIPSRAVQVLATTNINQNSLSNVPKVESRNDQLPQNSEQTSVSSTTLEQLREFESVLEQVTNTSQMKERGNAKRTETLTPTSSSNPDFPSPGSSKVNTLYQTSLVSAISDLSSENRVSLTFISKASTTCTNTLISGTSPKITATTPVVVVQSCSRPLASPALSITSQNSPGSSPSTPPANSQQKINPKLSKPKTKSIGKTAPTTTLKVSTLPKPQQKPQEDEQTTQRIYAILDKYAEQLRNSPELKNKPAPRRRSNPPTNPSQSSKRKKSSQSKSKSFSSIPSCSGLEMSPGSEDLRTAGSEDSSNGVSQVTQTVNSPHSRSEEHSNPGGDISSDVADSVDKDQRLQHRILLTDQSGGTSRTVIVQDNVQPVISVEGGKVIAGKQLVVGSSATVPLTLSLPGTGNVKQVLFPVPADGRPFVVAKVPKMYRFHQVTMPSGSPLIASASSGTVLLRQMCLNKSNSTLKQVKLPVVSQISTHMASQPTVVLPSGSQSFTLSTGSSIDSDSLGIALDNTILLNSSSASASSIGFIQRNLSKSNQSSNILTQNRQMASQESNTNSSGNELITTIKSENTVIKSENLSADTSRTSDSCDDFKSEDVKFSVDGSVLHEKTSKGVSLISSPSTNNNWVQVLKDTNNGNNILNKMEDKNISKKDTLDSKGSDNFENNLERRSDDSKRPCSDQTIKQQKLVDAGSYCIEGINDSKSIINSQLNDHWQFNIKLEKVCNTVKSESLSPCLRETMKEGDNLSSVQQSSLSQSQGLKRKVENTIFQIAFKRDKMKLAKDDFIQQRSASAIERELRLQKSLSEECEDLGVDKPSTSDLFPEAELLLDPDPLSRDSLQGELFPRAESSSSSLSSPNRSPIFSSKCSNSWRKQKRGVLRHKFSYTRSSSPKKILSDKTDSSRESTPINVNSSSSKSMSFEVKHSDSNFKSISKESECDVHENDIAMECNDSDGCNFSDVDEHNDTDLLDSEGDSDTDFLHKTQDKHGCNSPIQKDLDSEKSMETSLLRRLSSDNAFNKCEYYLNKESIEKRSVESSPWFHMMKGIHKESLDSEIDKSNNGSGEDLSESQNGVLEDYDDHQRSINNFVSNKVLQPRKRKKVGLFAVSPSEDSVSSIDTILAGSDSVCSDFHDNLRKRSSSRGRVKKGCPCFNGSPEPTKKKKDLPIHDKTDKPCSTKTSFSFSNKKSVSKSPVKLVNRKR